MTLEQNVVADLLDIAANTPLHADELTKCADRVRAMTCSGFIVGLVVGWGL